MAINWISFEYFCTMITLLYALWICYTVGSLSIILFVVSLGLYNQWETKKRLADLRKQLEENKDCPREDW
jgi:hypothetical protein